VSPRGLLCLPFVLHLESCVHKRLLFLCDPVNHLALLRIRSVVARNVNEDHLAIDWVEEDVGDWVEEDVGDWVEEDVGGLAACGVATKSLYNIVDDVGLQRGQVEDVFVVQLEQPSSLQIGALDTERLGNTLKAPQLLLNGGPAGKRLRVGAPEWAILGKVHVAYAPLHQQFSPRLAHVNIEAVDSEKLHQADAEAAVFQHEDIFCEQYLRKLPIVHSN